MSFMLCQQVHYKTTGSYIHNRNEDSGIFALEIATVEKRQTAVILGRHSFLLGIGADIYAWC